MNTRIRLLLCGFFFAGTLGCAGMADYELFANLDLDPTETLEELQQEDQSIQQQLSGAAEAAAAASVASGKRSGPTPASPPPPPPGGVSPAAIVASQGCPTGDTRYFASSAASDPAVHNGNHFHSIWAPKFFCNKTARWDFEQGATVDLFAAGGARIRGVAVVASGACGREGERWQVEVMLDDDPTGSMVPKRELKNPGVNQPPSVTDDWLYYLVRAGEATLTQIDGDGVATLTHRPTNQVMGFQVGFTANGKNTEFGLSGWFYYAHDPGNGATTRNGHGDFNIDLAECMDRPPTSSYVAWGTGTCNESAGYRLAYSGVAHAVARREIVAGGGVSMALSGPICSPNVIGQSGLNTDVVSNNLLVQVDHFRSLSDPNVKYLCAVCVK